MSWLFSRALVVAYLPGTCLDGEPSAPLSVMPTPHKFWRNVKTMDACDLSRFGLTCEVLTESRGEELLTLFLAGFRAKTLASRAKAWESTESEADYGANLPASLARYDPGTHSLKTAQLSLLGDSTGCYVTLPRSGMMRDGMLFQLPTLAHTMSVIDCGLSRERFPTPTVCGNYNRKGASKTSGDGLATYVKKYPHAKAADMSLTAGCLADTGARTVKARKWPTPTATAYKGWSKNHNRADTDDRLDYTIEREAHISGQPGRLNPTWEEWLMGWPIGWTELKPLEMDKFLEWQRQHSPRSLSEPNSEALRND